MRASQKLRGAETGWTKENSGLPWLVAQLVGASSQTPKGWGFDSQSGHIPRFQVPSSVDVQIGGSQMLFLSHQCFSTSVSLSPSFFSKKQWKNVFRWGLKQNKIQPKKEKKNKQESRTKSLTYITKQNYSSQKCNLNQSGMPDKH